MNFEIAEKGTSLYAPPWLPDAGCRTSDPDLFFAEDGKYNTPKTQEAIKVCRSCPVIRMCLSWALETGDSYAVLGGMTPQQRTKYRRELEYSNSVRRLKNR